MLTLLEQKQLESIGGCNELTDSTAQAACKVPASDIVFPVILDVLDESSDPAWVEAGWLAYFATGIRDLVDTSAVPVCDSLYPPRCSVDPSTVQQAASDPEVQGSVQQWTTGLCNYSYCTLDYAEFSWDNYTVFQSNSNSGPAEKCYYNGRPTDTRNCKQHARLSVNDFINDWEERTDGRRTHVFWAAAKKTRGWFDGPNSGREENLGVTWGVTGDSNSYPQQWWQLKPGVVLYAFREKLFKPDPYMACFTAFDTRKVVDVTTWTSSYDGLVDRDSVRPSGTRGDGFVYRYLPAFDQKTYVGPGTWEWDNCRDSYASAEYLDFEHRITLSVTWARAEADPDYAANGPFAYGTLIHRWVSWGSKACTFGWKSVGFFFSGKVGVAIKILSLLVDCSAINDRRNWTYQLGPIRSRV